MLAELGLAVVLDVLEPDEPDSSAGKRVISPAALVVRVMPPGAGASGLAVLPDLAVVMVVVM